MVADLVTQMQAMNKSELEGIMRIGEATLQPYNRSKPSITITAIEVLSPANKDHSAGRKAYRQKQEEYLLGGISLVEIDLIEQPDGTLLRLTHTGLPNAEQCAGHAEGWAHYLGRLAEVAAGRDPGPDPWHGRTGE